MKKWRIYGYKTYDLPLSYGWSINLLPTFSIFKITNAYESNSIDISFAFLLWQVIIEYTYDKKH